MTGPLDAQLVPPNVRAVLDALKRAGVEAYVVGGCVRDLLRGVAPSDWDVAADAPPERLCAIFPTAAPTGLAHGTITTKDGVEVTSYRGDGPYLDGRHPSHVTFGVPLHEDLARRDFTVNAIAWDPDAGSEGVVDPFGGRADLEARTLRAVGDPERRFAEDGLRTMRAARFAATLDLELDAATRAALPGARAVLARVAWERRRDELDKLLLAARPSVGLRVMEEAKLLDEVVPELRASVGTAQNRWHAYDVWTHTLAVVDAAPGRPVVRWAALLHDVAKPRCRATSPAGEVTFYDHENVGAGMSAEALDRLRCAHALRDAVAHLVKHHLVPYDPAWGDAAVRRFVARVGREALADLFDLARADALGKGKPELEAEQEALLRELADRIERVAAAGAAVSVRELAIGGREVMEALGITGGPAVGAALRDLLEWVMAEPARNTPQTLVAELRRRARETQG